jgi:hypothetical protein
LKGATVFIAMEIDWTSTRTVASAIALLGEKLPRDLTAIVADYADISADIEAICASAFMGQHRIISTWSSLSSRCILSNWLQPEGYELGIGFTYGTCSVLCMHVVEIDNRNLWDFACGEPILAINAVIKRHVNNEKELEQSTNEARQSLRRKLNGAAKAHR